MSGIRLRKSPFQILSSQFLIWRPEGKKKTVHTHFWLLKEELFKLASGYHPFNLSSFLFLLYFPIGLSP